MTPTSLAGEIGRLADLLAVGGDHRRQRPLHDRRDADQVDALLARDREVVDVEDREVGAAGPQQLRGVGRGARRLDLDVDAVVGEEPVLLAA